jgi:hypothetical protein
MYWRNNTYQKFLQNHNFMLCKNILKWSQIHYNKFSMKSKTKFNEKQGKVQGPQIVF